MYISSSSLGFEKLMHEFQFQEIVLVGRRSDLCLIVANKFTVLLGEFLVYIVSELMSPLVPF